MVIVTAADDRFALPLGVMLHSLIVNARPDTTMIVYVLSDGISPRQRQRIESVVRETAEDRNVTLKWIEVDTTLLHSAQAGTASLKTSAIISEATYLRLLIPDLVPDDYDRAIYLDADLIVERDLALLWNDPFGPFDLLAVRDYKIQTVSHPKGLRLYAEFGLSPDHPYFNAGVLVLNLASWREKDLSSKVFSYLHDYRAVINENDQDGLNAVLSRSWKPLDVRWNRQSAIFTFDQWPESTFKNAIDSMRQSVENEPYIDHFTSGDKPWNVSSAHPSRDRFLKYLSSSSWFTPLELRAWRALQTLRIPEAYLRTVTRPFRHRIRGILSNV